MTLAELQRRTAPFLVYCRGEGKRLEVTGFSQNDPLGVGGGLFPDMPTVYFKSGGWLLVSDFLNHYEFVPPNGWAGMRTDPRRTE